MPASRGTFSDEQSPIPDDVSLLRGTPPELRSVRVVDAGIFAIVQSVPLESKTSKFTTVDDSTDSPVDPWGFARGVQSVGPNLGNGPVNVIRPIAAIPVRVSRSMQGYLLRRVEPIYPTMAKTVGVQGQVLIKAIISTEGKIEQAKVVSGSPLLSSAALDAIRQWLYRPYLLNDKPVEVETEITVNFYLTH